MKKYNFIFNSFVAIAALLSMASCNDFLDKEPPSNITPEKYFQTEIQVQSYADGLYHDVMPWHTSIGSDNHTDNQAGFTFDNKYVPGQWKTAQKGGAWDFSEIYKCNYFLDVVSDKFEKGEISGQEANIKYNLGEAYFMRAFVYFGKYVELGDFPIIEHHYDDKDKQALIDISKRAPRTEVARFILDDLDRAIANMPENSVSERTRITREAAYFFKSRVALFEGTWLKYFKGTAFVPNGPNWPGATKEYNKNYEFKSGSIDGEIEFFLKEAMASAKKVIPSFTLVDNTGLVQQSADEPINPYMDLFSATDINEYSEAILWRQYSKTLGITHNTPVAGQHGNQGVGVTRGLVNGFLMKNGLPIYASNSGFYGDETITEVKKDRDSRLAIFLKEPKQKNILYPDASGDHAVLIEPYPKILIGDVEKGYSTGYTLRKWGTFYQNQCANGLGYTADVIFRGAELYLNYIEACYELNGSLDADAKAYWRALRTRSHVDTDFEKTINATVMTEEAKYDWSAYSAGQLVDATLFNIRRERRCELMAEGLRWIDLRRWRACDQMINTPYHIEGFKIWGSMQHWYDDEDGNSKLIADLDNEKANVSPEERSVYLRPYEKRRESLAFDGYRFTMAHYLSPIAIQNFMISSNTGDVEASPIYQNPYWPNRANLGPEEASN